MSEDVAATSTETDDVDNSTDESTQVQDPTAGEADADGSQAEGEPSEEEKAEAERQKKEAAEKAYQARQRTRERREREDAIRRAAALEAENRILREQHAQKRGTPDKAPKLEDFDSLDDFLDARDAWRDQSREQKKPQQPQQGADQDQPDPEYVRQLEAARDDLDFYGTEKHDDFREVVFSETAQITPVMRDAIFSMDEPDSRVDVAYFLGKNPKEAARIARLHPMRQIAEIGKIEARLSQPQAKPKRPSGAPAPVTPVGGNKANANALSDNLSTEEWVKRRNAQLQG